MYSKQQKYLQAVSNSTGAHHLANLVWRKYRLHCQCIRDQASIQTRLILQAGVQLLGVPSVFCTPYMFPSIVVWAGAVSHQEAQHRDRNSDIDSSFVGSANLYPVYHTTEYRFYRSTRDQYPWRGTDRMRSEESDFLWHQTR